TMDTTIDQQVAIDEALIPHAKRLRIERSNFRLLSDIKSKESTLQLMYDVLRITPFFKAILVTADVLEIFATGAAPPKPKASVWKTRSSSDTTITPPTAAAGATESVLRVAATGHDKRLFLKVVAILYTLSALGRLVSGVTVAYAGVTLFCLYILAENSSLFGSCSSKFSWRRDCPNEVVDNS
nr:reticulon-like protein B22 [Tanacetum cinerariifolium]